MDHKLTHISARHGLLDIDFAELFRFRELLFVLSWRQIAVRYKQSLIGALWVLLQPAIATLIFSFIFGYLARFPSDGVPYPLFVLSGLLLWQFFTKAVGEGSNALVTNQALLTKIYFPRLYLPGSAVLPCLFDLFISLVLLVPLMILYDFVPGWTILLAPVFVGLAFLLAFGLSLWLSALNALYRDIRFVVPFALQIGMYVTPVIYAPSFVPERYRWVLDLNPMTGIIQGIRWSILDQGVSPSTLALGVSVGATAFILLGGIVFFKRLERSVADRI